MPNLCSFQTHFRLLQGDAGMGNVSAGLVAVHAGSIFLKARWRDAMLASAPKAQLFGIRGSWSSR
jgi:hypothetical protein